MEGVGFSSGHNAGCVNKRSVGLVGDPIHISWVVGVFRGTEGNTS